MGSGLSGGKGGNDNRQDTPPKPSRQGARLREYGKFFERSPDVQGTRTGNTESVRQSRSAASPLACTAKRRKLFRWCGGCGTASDATHGVKVWPPYGHGKVCPTGVVSHSAKITSALSRALPCAADTVGVLTEDTCCLCTFKGASGNRAAIRTMDWFDGPGALHRLNCELSTRHPRLKFVRAGRSSIQGRDCWLDRPNADNRLAPT